MNKGKMNEDEKRKFLRMMNKGRKRENMKLTRSKKAWKLSFFDALIFGLTLNPPKRPKKSRRKNVPNRASFTNKTRLGSFYSVIDTIRKRIW